MPDVLRILDKYPFRYVLENFIDAGIFMTKHVTCTDRRVGMGT